MLVPVPPVVPGVVALPGTDDEGTVVLCGTWVGDVVLPGMVLRGTLLLGLVPCCKLPGVVVRGTAFGSVGVEGTVVLLGVVAPGVVALLGTVLDGTVEGCTVPVGVVVDDGCVTELPGRDAPGRLDGCMVLPGTVFGCVVLPG